MRVISLLTGILMTALFLLMISPLVSAEWEHHDPFPGYDISAVFVENETSVYAGTKYGSLAHWNGVEWSIEVMPSHKEIYKIHKTDDGVLLVVFNRYMYWRSDGSEWQPADLYTMGYRACVTGYSQNALYASVEENVYQFNDGEWIAILEASDMSDHYHFGDILSTREGDLLVSGFNIDGYWFKPPFLPPVFITYEFDPATYKYVDGGLEPFAGVTGGNGRPAGGRSIRHLYFSNGTIHRSMPLTSSSIIHYNGSFFSTLSEIENPHVAEFGMTQSGNGLFFWTLEGLSYWDSTIPIQFPALPDNEVRLSDLSGMSDADFWVATNRGLFHWTGSIPLKPAETGVFIKMNDYYLNSGDTFSLEIVAGNASDEIVQGDVYVVMMIFGMDGLWFWPEWSQEPQSLSVPVTLDPGSMETLDTLSFTWPQIDASFDALFHSVLVLDNGDIRNLKSIGFSVR